MTDTTSPTAEAREFLAEACARSGETSVARMLREGHEILVESDDAIDAISRLLSRPTAAPNAAKHRWDRMDRPRTCTKCGYEEHDGSGIGYVDCSTPPASTAAPDGVEVERMAMALDMVGGLEADDAALLTRVSAFLRAFSTPPAVSREDLETAFKDAGRRWWLDGTNKPLQDFQLDAILALLASPPIELARVAPLRSAVEEMLAAFAEGVVWNDEQRTAYEALDAALRALPVTPAGEE